MRFTVKINRKSIKANPNAGEYIREIVSGTVCSDGKGGAYRNCQPVYSMCPEPNFFFEYEPCYVVCDSCKKEFLKEELIDDLNECWDDELELWYFEGSCLTCPFCGKKDCCELEWEKLDESGNVHL